MQTVPRVIAFRYLISRLHARISAVAAGDQESGALSLEWVAIAIVLVTTALALAVFLAGKLGALESLIPD